MVGYFFLSFAMNDSYKLFIQTLECVNTLQFDQNQRAFVEIIMNIFLYFQGVICLLQFPTPKCVFSYTHLFSK